MAVVEAGVYRRTEDDEAEDSQTLTNNIKDGAFTTWPNETGFDGLEEHRGPIDLPVKGHIPAWAAGSLYRTGPGESKIEGTARGTHHVSHWFDGFAHSHRFDIVPAAADIEAGATVRYSSRRQSEAFIAEIKRKGWRDTISFAQRADPCVGIFSKLMSVFNTTQENNAVVIERNVPGPRWHKSLPATASSASSKTESAPTSRAKTDNLFIMTDTSVLQEVDPATLEPLAYWRSRDLHPDLTGPLAAAHAQRDPVTGDLFNFNLAFGPRPTYRVFRVSAATGATEVLATLPAHAAAPLNPGYIHSLFLTPSYVVLCIPSSHFGANGLRVVWKGNLVDGMDPFDEQKLVQWVVIDRRGNRGVVGRFTSSAGFFFHSVNAFEEQVVDKEGKSCVQLTFDAVWYPSTDIISAFYYDVILDRDGAGRKFWADNYGYKTCRHHLVRYQCRLPATDKQSSAPSQPFVGAAEEVLSIPSPHCGELPTINSAYAARPYRYVYACANRGLSTLFDSIVKTDLQTREALVWSGSKGHTPGEPIFVARPGAAEGDEDDGVVLSVVLDGEASRSYLLCLDARTLKELGRAEASFAIALGLHGVHAPDAHL